MLRSLSHLLPFGPPWTAHCTISPKRGQEKKKPRVALLLIRPPLLLKINAPFLYLVPFKNPVEGWRSRKRGGGTEIKTISATGGIFPTSLLFLPRNLVLVFVLFCFLFFPLCFFLLVRPSYKRRKTDGVSSRAATRRNKWRDQPQATGSDVGS